MTVYTVGTFDLLHVGHLALLHFPRNHPVLSKKSTNLSGL